MQTRHRIPTIFTLYMVDVLCCALGCVILLWFLKIHEARGHLQEAQRREQEAEQTGARLVQTRAELDKTVQEMAGIRGLLQAAEGREQQTNLLLQTSRKETKAAENERDQIRSQRENAIARADVAEKEGERLRAALATLSARADALVKERDSVRTRVADLDKQLAALMTQKTEAEDRLAAQHKTQVDLEKQLAAMTAQSTAAEDRLAKQNKAQADLEKDLIAARQRSDSLETLLRDKDSLAKEISHTADQLAERLRDMNARTKELRAQADLVPGLRQEAQTATDKVGALQTQNQTLDQELSDRKKELLLANQTLLMLQGEKKVLADQVTRAKAVAENRFAGIALTGQRVVFLVDMSGSMDLVDEQTLAPDKWSGVRETLAKIMRSLPNLEKYQVVLFSDRITFLMGNDGQWLDYHPLTSADEVVQALKAVKPHGNTDMYLALDAAFRFRPAGLDTIYLLSDGLPNIGEGLSAEASRTMTEDQRSVILSKYVRKALLTSMNQAGTQQPRVRINTIGFFFESPDVGAFLWALARENDGSFVGMSKP